MQHFIRIGTTASLAIYLQTISVIAQAQDKPAAAPRDPVLVTISEKTTRITAPLKESGYPDFLEAVNIAAKGKVTPETNGAVLVVRAMAPADLTPEQKIDFYRRLGIEPIAESQSQFLSYESFISRLPNKKLPKPTREENKIKDKAERFEKIRERLHEDYEYCSEQSWKDQEYPLIAEWLKQQAAALKHLDDLPKYPSAYLPIVHGTKNSSLLYANSPLHQPLRSLANALAIRGQWAVSEERFEEAIDDFERILILRGYLRQQPSLISCLVSGAISNYPLHQLFRSTIASLKLSSEQIQRLQNLLAKHDQYESIFSTAIDINERWITLDAICRYGECGMQGSQGSIDEVREKLEYRKLYDYDLMLTRANQEFDRQRDIWSIRDSLKRLQAANDLDIEQHQRDPILVFPATKYIAFLTKEGRSKYMIEAMIVMTAPSASLVRDIGVMRDHTRRVMWYTTLQMFKYRQNHGRFPEKLTQLLPDASPNAPLDYAVWQESLTYQGQGNSFLLYSWDYDSIDQQGYRGDALNGDHCDDLALFTADSRPKPPKIGYPPRNF